MIDDGRDRARLLSGLPARLARRGGPELAARLSGSLADSEQSVFWLDSPAAPEPLPPLEGEARCDLAIVGGGFTGLWAALLAAPDEDVVLLEGDRCGWGASGRNGGFAEASLTHGLENGLSRWPDEIDELERLSRGELRRDARDARARAVSTPPGRSRA